jgi:ATP adenylyltransferase
MEREYFLNFSKLEYVTNPKARKHICLLCEIVRQSKVKVEEEMKVPDLTIHKGTYFTVVVNLYPYNPGHVMIFPNRHIEDIRQLTASEEQELPKLRNQVLDVLDQEYHAAGYNIGYNLGDASGASISHIHLHIIPRYPRETGIADLLGGKKVLVESPFDTVKRLKKYFG